MPWLLLLAAGAGAWWLFQKKGATSIKLGGSLGPTAVPSFSVSSTVKLTGNFTYNAAGEALAAGTIGTVMSSSGNTTSIVVESTGAPSSAYGQAIAVPNNLLASA